MAVDGVMCPEQSEKLRIIRSHMDALYLAKLNLESLILSVAEMYLHQLNLVLTVPGIQSFSAIAIIGEIGVDMSVFPTSKQLCSWAGLTPQNNKSAGKKKNYSHFSCRSIQQASFGTVCQLCHPKQSKSRNKKPLHCA